MKGARRQHFPGHLLGDVEAVYMRLVTQVAQQALGEQQAVGNAVPSRNAGGELIDANWGHVRLLLATTA